MRSTLAKVEQWIEREYQALGEISNVMSQTRCSSEEWEKVESQPVEDLCIMQVWDFGTMQIWEKVI